MTPKGASSCVAAMLVAGMLAGPPTPRAARAAEVVDANQIIILSDDISNSSTSVVHSGEPQDSKPNAGSQGGDAEQNEQEQKEQERQEKQEQKERERQERQEQKEQSRTNRNG